LGASAATLSLVLPGRQSSAQAYPSQDIHFVVGFAPGSGPDLITRWIADKIKPHLNNRTIIVENKVGAGGNIASEYVARAKADGYVIYVTGGSALAASGHLFKNPPVDVVKAFDMIATLARQPTLVAIAANSPYKTVGDLQAAMRTKGDKASFATAFPTARVLGAMLRDSAGGKAVEVQYRTSADWINDLASGAIDFGIIDSASGSGHARQGRIRILAVSTADRFSTMPEIQTLKEAGLDIDMAGWWAAYAPAGTPPAILDQLHVAFTAVVKSPEAKVFFNGITNEPWATTRSQAQEIYLKEYKDWGNYVRIAKIEPQG
jgi:tripartite-type tricarboxylate transporter receptor subunit TctC